VACIDAFRRNGIGTNHRVSRSAHRADGGWHRAGCRRLFRKWQFDFHPAVAAVEALADRRRRLRRPAEAFHPQRPCISLGTVRLAGSLFCALPGTFGVHLCRADLPAPNDLARFGAHGAYYSGLASPGNATRIRCPERPRGPHRFGQMGNLYSITKNQAAIRDLFKVAYDTTGAAAVRRAKIG
jgi:hypothetical protein